MTAANDLVATFLEFACWDHHVHGVEDHRMHDCAAGRLLTHNPEIARDSVYTAVVCGDLAEVQRLLAARPDTAREAGGSRDWTPLLYLCYTRFSNRATIDNAVAIGRALLDGGANPNDFYMAGDARYTALVGVAGEGEQDSPRQPQSDALFQLLLDRGAEPFDVQVLYNTHFRADMIWWLDLVYAHTIATGRAAAWADPTWAMLDMGGYGPGAHFILHAAIQKNNLTLAGWALAHGASPGPHPSADPKFKLPFTLYQRALLDGLTEMADLLVRHGAAPPLPVLNDEEAFLAACFRLDLSDVRTRVARHPEYLRTPKAICAAVTRDRADVVSLLLDLGVPIEIEGRGKQRTLHVSAARNALRSASLLIERGADVDPRDGMYHNTPLGWAMHFGHEPMIDFLSRFSRDVWHLSFAGRVDRLRDVLRAEPDLAKGSSQEGITPLWWLPEDDAKAMETVELFIGHGADPSVRSHSGGTAAGWARKRGMVEIARMLDGEANARRS